MPQYRWNDSLLIGVPLCDEHHQHLFDLFNKTYGEITADSTPQDIADLFRELMDYAAYHFSVEERLMAQNGFPGREEHMKEHRSFSDRVATMHKAHCEGQTQLSREVLAFLTNWISTHIQKLDARFGRYMACSR
jgi:hemerythrin-like metal-binding protein